MRGAGPIFDGYPPRREAYLARTSQRCTHRDDGYPARQRRRWAVFSSLLIPGELLGPDARGISAGLDDDFAETDNKPGRAGKIEDG